MLAVQLARHATFDWYSEKMHKLYEEAAEWLDEPMSVLIKETHQLAVTVAHDTKFYNVTPAAALLLMGPTATDSQENKEFSTASIDKHTGICLIPQLYVMKDVVNKLKNLPEDTKTLHEIIKLTIQGLHDGAGLNRVVRSEERRVGKECRL